MADLYRKSSLEKLSSPEQLDRMIVITSPSFWIAMLGTLAIVVTALLWSIFGRLPMKVESNGIYVNGEGVFSVYAQAEGTVTDVLVDEGQAVTNGQPLMRLTNTSNAHEMSQLQQRIEQVRAVTLTSVNDEATADSKSLVDIKTQYLTLHAELATAQTSLGQKQKDFATQKAEAGRLAGVMESAKTAYYAAIGVSGDPAVQVEYQEASSVMSQAQGNYDSARLQYQPLLDNLDAIGAEYLAAIEAYNAAVTDASHVVAAELQPPATLGVDATLYPNEFAGLEDLWTNGVLPAKAAEEQARPTFELVKADYDAATARMDAARTAYVQASNNESVSSAAAQKLSSEFQIAQSNYQNALSLQMNLEAEIKSLQQQITAEGQRIAGQSDVLDTQFLSEKDAILSQLEAELAKYKLNSSLMEIMADRDGVITGLQVKQGAVVGAGTELIKVKQSNLEENVVVCYVPLSEGKAITPGMTVMVCPTTVNEQEYGHIEATVVQTDTFTTTSTDIMARLGDNVLTEAFIKDGPVIAVTCQLETDPATASGYRWSSAKGRDIIITEGTLVTARIVTSEKSPISMIIPLLKETFTVKAGE